MQRAAHDTEALVLKRVETGEADLIVTLFSERLGRVSAVARSARKSRKRFGGALEPFFTLRARLEERPRSDIFLLSEAQVVSARLGLLQNLERLNAAGRALAWIREAAPPRTPEPEVWQVITRWLDRLATADRSLSADGELAELGLALLGSFGWGIDFERCVSCGRPCPESAPASVDPVRGGLVCRRCGGGRVKLSAEARARLARAAAGEASALERDDVRTALELVERVFLAHAGVG